MCVNPITIVDKVSKEVREVPCGCCLNCRIKRQADLEFICKKELLTCYNKGLSASFLTLTYDEDNLPYVLHNDRLLPSLRKSDLQKFHKKFRRFLDYYNFKEKTYKYLQCGEYGDSFGRPHYHLIIFGIGADIINSFVKRFWKFGSAKVGTLTSGGLRYVLKYCTKSPRGKSLKDIYDSFGVERPFINHSIGIGRQWIIEHAQEIADNNFLYFSSLTGQTMFPKYIYQQVNKILKTNIKTYAQFCQDFDLKKRKNSGLSAFDYNNWKKEQAFLKEKMLSDVLSRKGMVVDNFLLNSQSYVKPDSYYDNTFMLAYQALNFS